MSKTYWVYILKCSDGSYYTGSTSDLENRVIEHQSGVIKGYASKRLPVELVYNENSEDVYEILNAERQIKKWTREKKEALISGDFKLLRLLSECKNLSHSKNYVKDSVKKPDGSTTLTNDRFFLSCSEKDDSEFGCKSKRSPRINQIVKC